MTRSWIESANRPDTDFPLDNLPWCRFNGGRSGVAIGDLVLDIEAAGVPSMDRERLTDLLRHDTNVRPPSTLR